jgi:hypothetical protein
MDRLDLSICDELGFMSLGADRAWLLFILLAHRHARGTLRLPSTGGSPTSPRSSRETPA